MRALFSVVLTLLILDYGKGLLFLSIEPFQLEEYLK